MAEFRIEVSDELREATDEIRKHLKRLLREQKALLHILAELDGRVRKLEKKRIGG